MDILPISTCSPEDAPDLYLCLTTGAASSTECGAPELNVLPNELCRQKMVDIVIDLVDADLL